MSEEKIEKYAFKNKKTLSTLNETDLLEIIEFLQLDRKQWINQYTQMHNEYVDLQQENKRLNENNLAIQEEMARTWKKCKQSKKELSKERTKNIVLKEANRLTNNQRDLYKSTIEKALNCLNIDGEILKTCSLYDVNGIEIYKILIKYKGE